MTVTRRNVLTSTLAAAGAVLTTRQALAQDGHQHPQPTPAPTPPTPAPAPAAKAPAAARLVTAAGKHELVVPNGSLLPWKLVDGIKVFHLRAEPLTHTIAPGLEIEAWGYNGSTPGPVI